MLQDMVNIEPQGSPSKIEGESGGLTLGNSSLL